MSEPRVGWLVLRRDRGCKLLDIPGLIDLPVYSRSRYAIEGGQDLFISLFRYYHATADMTLDHIVGYIQFLDDVLDGRCPNGDGRRTNLDGAKRCRARRGDGSRCGARALPNSDFCRHHQPPKPAKSADQLIAELVAALGGAR